MNNIFAGGSTAEIPYVARKMRIIQKIPSDLLADFLLMLCKAYTLLAKQVKYAENLNNLGLASCYQHSLLMLDTIKTSQDFCIQQLR